MRRLGEVCDVSWFQCVGLIQKGMFPRSCGIMGILLSLPPPRLTVLLLVVVVGVGGVSLLLVSHPTTLGCLPYLN